MNFSTLSIYVFAASVYCTPIPRVGKCNFGKCVSTNDVSRSFSGDSSIGSSATTIDSDVIPSRENIDFGVSSTESSSTSTSSSLLESKVNNDANIGRADSSSTRIGNDKSVTTTTNSGATSNNKMVNDDNNNKASNPVNSLANNESYGNENQREAANQNDILKESGYQNKNQADSQLVNDNEFKNQEASGGQSLNSFNSNNVNDGVFLTPSGTLTLGNTISGSTPFVGVCVDGVLYYDGVSSGKSIAIRSNGQLTVNSGSYNFSWTTSPGDSSAIPNGKFIVSCPDNEGNMFLYCNIVCEGGRPASIPVLGD